MSTTCPDAPRLLALNCPTPPGLLESSFVFGVPRMLILVAVGRPPPPQPPNPSEEAVVMIQSPSDDDSEIMSQMLGSYLMHSISIGAALEYPVGISLVDFFEGPCGGAIG